MGSSQWAVAVLEDRMTVSAIARHRFEHRAMATIFEVIIDLDDAKYARQAAQAVFQEVDRLEGLLSRFNPTSDVSQLNRLAPGQSIRVSYELCECVAMAQQIAHITNGAFDVTVGEFMNRVRASQGRVRMADNEREELVARGGMKRILLDPDSLSISIQPVQGEAEGGPISVDLGGIGKGYALDKGAELLREWGIESALIHAGTSTALALGSPAVEPNPEPGFWLLGAGAEWDRAAGFGTVRIQNEALSGSGKRVKGEHILDPRTGFPARRHLAAWSIAPSATVADALSTAFMVMTTAEVRKFCKSFGAAALLVVRRRGILGAFQEEVIATPGFRQRSVALRATDS